jgi:hypothetical protein
MNYGVPTVLLICTHKNSRSANGIDGKDQLLSVYSVYSVCSVVSLLFQSCKDGFNLRTLVSLSSLHQYAI